MTSLGPPCCCCTKGHPSVPGKWAARWRESPALSLTDPVPSLGWPPSLHPNPKDQGAPGMWQAHLSWTHAPPGGLWGVWVTGCPFSPRCGRRAGGDTRFDTVKVSLIAILSSGRGWRCRHWREAWVGWGGGIPFLVTISGALLLSSHRSEGRIRLLPDAQVSSGLSSRPACLSSRSVPPSPSWD